MGIVGSSETIISKSDGANGLQKLLNIKENGLHSLRPPTQPPRPTSPPQPPSQAPSARRGARERARAESSCVVM